MIGTRFLCCSFIFALVISACSIEVAQPSVGTPSLAPNAFATNPGTTNNTDTTQIPVTWSSLNLTGKLIYNMGATENENYIVRVLSLDLVTGKVSTIYQALSTPGSITSRSLQIIISSLCLSRHPLVRILM